MSKPVELRFHIDAFTPATIPMSSLAAYLTDLATILGEPHSVHFDRLEGGSTSPVVRIDSEAAPAVLKRVQAVRMNEGPVDALRAKGRVEKRLAEHNAGNAELTDESGTRILLFRGREAAQEVYGPVRQAGEIVGTVIMIGGKNDPVSVHIEDGERAYVCEAKREVARRLAAHLFDCPVRVSGYGKYFRNDQGEWEMQEFRISDFEPLDPAPIGSILEKMRAIRPKWLDSADPLSTLRDDD